MSDLEAFFRSLGAKDPAKLAAELDTHDIHNLDDLAHLDDADRTELADELKSAGFSIGDRGKVKRASHDAIAKFRGAGRGGGGGGGAPPSRPPPPTGNRPSQPPPPAGNRPSQPPPPAGNRPVPATHHRASNIALPDHLNRDDWAHAENVILGLAADKKSADQMWARLDFNGNGIVSMAELDKWIKGTYPMLNNKRAILLAHTKTTRLDGDGDEWIQRNEFEMLLHNLFFFNKLIAIFSEIDTSGDGRVDFQEFVAGLNILGFGITREQAWREFNKMDDDRGGLVVFHEFCSYVSAKMWPGGFDDYYSSREDIGASARRENPGFKVHGKVKGKKGLDHSPDIHTTKYDQLEMEILGHVSSRAGAKKYFRSIDDNNSGKISQKEFTVWVKKAFPALTDKEAVTFAFEKTTNESEDGDKYVQPDEFRELFVNLFYFTKLKFVFNKMDKNHDSKISFKEFAKGLIWVGLTMDTNDALVEFDDIDSHAGGNGEIDFGEFCAWVARKKIPVD